MKKLEAIYNAVIVQPYEVEEESYSNIIVPDLGNEKNKTGKVISVGEGSMVSGVGFVPTKLKVDDIVVLPTMGFTRFEYKGEEYWIGPENQVLAVLKDE